MLNSPFKKGLFFLFFLCYHFVGMPQQKPDYGYTPQLKLPAYASGEGPTIYVDQGHRNFHQLDGIFGATAQLLKRDGYPVKAFEGKFDAQALQEVSILIIPNAMPEGFKSPYIAPTPSAFSPAEVQSLEKWVKEGGSLFLIADHMPFAGAAAPLAQAFGFTFHDGYALSGPNKGRIRYQLKDRSLENGMLSQAGCPERKVSQVYSFTGQAFTCPTEAQSYLNLDEDYFVFLSDTMGVIHKNTRKISANGMSQGAIMEYGQGKIAVFGEAAMFTAQLVFEKELKIGMNAPAAKENYKFFLNIIHWLDQGEVCPQ